MLNKTPKTDGLAGTEFAHTSDWFSRERRAKEDPMRQDMMEDEYSREMEESKPSNAN
ncbi:MAG: hypothetical protein K0S45_3984, partial [Nitrospira sp.]|nr:hypothetical protein [Nitrospira sp.]